MFHSEKIRKGIITLFNELDTIPAWICIFMLLVVVIGIVAYGVVLQKCNITEEQRSRYKRYCFRVLLALYIGIVLVATVINRPVNTWQRLNLIPLRSIRNYDHINSEIIRDLANVALFFPLGILFASQLVGRRRWLKSVALSAAFSFTIEALQYICCVGSGDVDDLICNTLGGLVGAVACSIFRFAFQKKSVGRIILRIIVMLMLAAAAIVVASIGLMYVYVK